MTHTHTLCDAHTPPGNLSLPRRKAGRTQTRGSWKEALAAWFSIPKTCQCENRTRPQKKNHTGQTTDLIQISLGALPETSRRHHSEGIGVRCSWRLLEFQAHLNPHWPTGPLQGLALGKTSAPVGASPQSRCGHGEACSSLKKLDRIQQRPAAKPASPATPNPWPTASKRDTTLDLQDAATAAASASSYD